MVLGQSIPTHFNIAPTLTVPIIRRSDETVSQDVSMVRWGLIPHWAKDLKIPPFFNARADKLPGNKVFWPSIHQRCLVPMAGFYEWSEHDKQPYFISVIDDPIAYAAGLWTRWQSPEGKTIESCTIITTQPNETLADIHHRMPVLLESNNHDAWLDDPFDTAKSLLTPYSQPMEKYPVNPKAVNNARNNSIECLDHWRA